MKKTSYSIIKKSSGSFEKTITDITAALKDEGFGILTEIDVAKTLKKKLDVAYPNYIILGACSPSNAYRALQAEKEIGLLLPCNVIVYEDDNEIYVGIMKPTVILALTDNKVLSEVAKEVEGKLIRTLNKIK